MAKLQFAVLAMLAILLSSLPYNASAASDQEWEAASLSSGAVDAASAQIFSGEGLLYGIIPSTAANANPVYITFRDTGTVMSSGQVDPLFTVNVTTNSTVPSVSQNPWELKNPIRFSLGLVTTANSCPTKGTIPCYSVLFRKVYR